MRAALTVLALAAILACANVSAHDGQTPPGPEGQPKTVREQVRGGVAFPPETRWWFRVTGKVKVLDAHTLVYEDGTEVDLIDGMDAPDLGQKGRIGDAFYPCGEEAAEFLRKLIGDRAVTCLAHRDHVAGKKMRVASGYVGETNLNIEMVRNGWAISHHSGMDGWEIIARENKRGLWRGKFVLPDRWRKGERLPGEPADTESERRALAALQAFNPVVKVDETRPGQPVVAVQFRPNVPEKAADADLAHLGRFPHLRVVELSSQPITDAGLAHLAGLPQLEELNLNWTRVTAAGVIQLVKGRTKLVRLELGGVKLRDDDLAELKSLTDLRVLSLRATLVTDEGVALLKPFTKLRGLSLMSTGVGDAGLRHLNGLTDLEDVDLDRTAITDAGLENIRALRNLRRLQMAHTAVTDAGLERLQDLSGLKSLNLRGTRVTEVGVDKLKRRIPQLQAGFGPAVR
jgi:endonuclease YncB( thermonuclease family)